MQNRPIMVDRQDAWAIHDCLQGALAGFSGRSETAEPWHGLRLMGKLRTVLLAFGQPDAPTHVPLELTRGELECIDLNVPRTAYAGAGALLLRVFHAIEELEFEFPLLADEPADGAHQDRLARWRRGEGAAS